MKRQKFENNLTAWHAKRRASGLAKLYSPLERNGDLAELIGIVLGDGYVGAMARTEVLRIVGDSAKWGFIARSAMLVEKVFNKQPSIGARKNSNGVNITLYEKHIGKRLGIHAGAQGDRVLRVPRWILASDEYVIRYLRGLYEAEGSFSVHEPTYTYKFIFKNANESLLDIVERLVKRLGFHPHRSYRMVQVSRKVEVYKLVELLQYRRY